MNYTSFSYSIDLQGLRDVQTKINTPPVAVLPELDGMFYRGQDFTQSHANLNEQFFAEYRAANAVLPKAKDADEVHGSIPSVIRISSSGKDHFTTFSLSPALRHFVNDSCRLLEPFTPLLASKYPEIKLRRRQNFDSYIKDLLNAGNNPSFDSNFIIELYEIWNDYKHRQTRGLQVSPWKYEEGKVIKAKLQTPSELDIHLPILKDMEIDEFVNQTTRKILDVLNFVI